MPRYIANYVHSVAQPGAAGGATLQQLGFHYVNMDASWDLPDRDSNGKLVPDPALWPSGIESTSAHVRHITLSRDRRRAVG